MNKCYKNIDKQLYYYFNNILPLIDMEKFYDDSLLLSPKKTMKKYLVGEIYKNSIGLEYIIIKYYKGNSKRLIKFLKTGYKTIIESKELEKGNIKDPFYPSIQNIGVVGEKYFEHQYSKNIIYTRWTDIIDRCYNENCKNYKSYGGKGVKICDKWLYYPNFYNDIINKSHYEDLINSPSEWDIDKDELQLNKDNKIYSNDTVQIIHSYRNIQIRNQENGLPIKNRKKVIQFDKNGNFIKEWQSSMDIALYFKNNPKRYKTINLICNKNKGVKNNYTAYGYIWRYKTNEYNDK